MCIYMKLFTTQYQTFTLVMSAKSIMLRIYYARFFLRLWLKYVKL